MSYRIYLWTILSVHYFRTTGATDEFKKYVSSGQEHKNNEIAYEVVSEPSHAGWDHFNKHWLWAWMKEVMDNTSRRGACLRSPVSTSVHFSFRNEGSSEYMCVKGERGGENIYRVPECLSRRGQQFWVLKRKQKQTLWWVQNWISRHIYKIGF